MNRLLPAALLGLLLSSCSEDTLFRRIPSSRSGIDFRNTIEETDSINVLDFENVYNGGGVGVGDFNGDSLPDLYFTGNLVANKLYINKGNLKFEDVTEKAGVAGMGRWGRGIAVTDINNDGRPDLYICNSIRDRGADRTNLLYINEGVGEGGIPRFREAAAAYGLADTAHNTMAVFFDYDRDGDNDVYTVANEIVDGDYPNRFRGRALKGEHPSTGKLYRNEGADSLGHPYFRDVSAEAGTTIEGYGHAAVVQDINADGWPDLYVTNDYLSPNILYINNGNGTFTDKVDKYFRHTSANAMGCDIVDLNGDSWPEVVELDMNPEDNYRKKMMLNANSYQTYQNSDYFGIQYQYVRNTLQLNNGPRPAGDSLAGEPVFSDVAFFAGVAETDWSWAPLVADYDLDGRRDLIVTNGFPKDVTDHDFIAFRDEAFAVASKKQLLGQIPEIKLPNYAFKNEGGMRFSNVSGNWGLTEASFSNGGAYADLDNDGDMDLVVNNINDEAFLYENTAAKAGRAWLSVSLQGAGANRDALGARITVHTGDSAQTLEYTPFRGYLSSIDPRPHFGLGSAKGADSVVVEWPSGGKSVVVRPEVNSLLIIREASSVKREGTPGSPLPTRYSLLTDITDSIGLTFLHQERDFIDFNIQKLLPHKFSEYGPAMAAGDVDGNGTDDLVVGGSFGQVATVLLQGKDGRFTERPLVPSSPESIKRTEDAGLLLFDAEGDGDNDLYIASGGYENERQTEAYTDRLFLNNGTGSFAEAPAGSLPRLLESKGCVRAHDWDRDGDLDLFVAGRVDPWNYPKPVSSYLLRNDSKGGSVRFTDVTASVAPVLKDIGLVTDALASDFDGDGWTDLVLAGEWMPVTLLKNTGGRFSRAAASGLEGQTGWWTSLLAMDADRDGDMDYIAGNLGLNSFYRASEKEPVRIYAKDFDGNGAYDAVPTLYLPASGKDGRRIEVPAQVRDDLTKQLISFRAKFQKYDLYAKAPFSEMFTKEELKGAQVLEARQLAHCILRNNGGGKFEVQPLPAALQYTCLNGMTAGDFTGDGIMDLLTTGNDYGTEVSVGRYDAGTGLLLQGDGKGGFRPVPMQGSGFYVPGNAKSLVQLRSATGAPLIAAAQNRGRLRLFAARTPGTWLPLGPADVSLRLADGTRMEGGWGASFMSQSVRAVWLPAGTAGVAVTDAQGRTRNVKP